MSFPKKAAVSETYWALQHVPWVSNILTPCLKVRSLWANQIQHITLSVPGTKELHGSRMALSGVQPTISAAITGLGVQLTLQASRHTRANFSSDTLTLVPNLSHLEIHSTTETSRCFHSGFFIAIQLLESNSCWYTQLLQTAHVFQFRFNV